MKYKIFGSAALVAAFALFAVAEGTQASSNLPADSIFKGRGHSTLYYLSEDGKRYVFPNEKTFKSWYQNFDEVVEIEDSELEKIKLGGNVRYKPGVYLIKITTDPKVYAVSGNGRLRWLKTERIAKALYGDNWNLLIDDVADSFFVNYAVDDPIEDEDTFDPIDEEDTIKSIDENRHAAKRFIKKVKKHARVCDNLEKQFNKLQDRLAERGIVIDNLGDDFLSTCVNGSLTDDDDDTDDDGVIKHGKARVCHKSDDKRRTITISKNAVKAHLRHGDKLGKCHDDDDNDDDDDTPADTTAPVLTNITSTVTTSTATITWNTNEAATSILIYATEPTSTASTIHDAGTTDLVTSHSITISGLTASTTYYYIVKARDAAGNHGIANEKMFTTDAEIIIDETAPVISAITTTIGSTTTTIAWATDEAATSKVIFADVSLDTASSTDSVLDNVFVTSHSLELTGLATSTQYFFKVESKDEADNTATSSETDFTTNA